MTEAPADILSSLRKRFLEDFEFWAKHCCKIRTKEGTIVPLVLNAVQKRFLVELLAQWSACGRVRMVVLKARQQGLSTVISAFMYWWLSQHQAQKGLVMAHVAESTQALFDMYKRVHSNTPEMLRPSTKYSSRTELVFDVLDTGLMVATAGGRAVARGETLQAMHLSEVAFWPVAFAETNFNGLIQALPEVANTFGFVESTAQGLTGKFRSLWVNALEMGWKQFFSSWFETPEYREKAPGTFERTPSEEELSEQYGLDNDQLYWRRRKIAQNGAELFKQEYPATADEAFLNTGRPVFNPETLVDRLSPENIKEPVKRMTVIGHHLDESPVGELLVYRELEEKERYVIGGDVGMGVRDGDYSVAQVLDSKERQVAVWRGLVHPDEFATVLQVLGFHYHTALIGCERNNHGILTCSRLRDSEYPLLYTETNEAKGQIYEDDTDNVGFLTNERTKPLIIDKLRAADRTRSIEINDPTTLREMMSYVTTERGRMEAEPGAYDDCVMALAIALHIHEGNWTPVKVTDEFYCKAI